MVIADIKYCKEKPKILFLILGFLVSLSKIYNTKVPNDSEINALKFIPKLGFNKIYRITLDEKANIDIFR